MNYGKKPPPPPPEPENSYENQWLKVDLAKSRIVQYSDFQQIELYIIINKPLGFIKVRFLDGGIEKFIGAPTGNGGYPFAVGQVVKKPLSEGSLMDFKNSFEQPFADFYLDTPNDPDPANHLSVPLWQIPGYNDVYQ